MKAHIMQSTSRESHATDEATASWCSNLMGGAVYSNRTVVRLYGCTGVTRTSAVWVLLMVASRSRFQTGCMTIDTKDDVWCRPALAIDTREDFHEVVLPHLDAG